MTASVPDRAEIAGAPAELTSFVGRRAERLATKRALSGYRLVTLTGSGGVGKTRLALRVGADLRRSFPDGVWFVDLSALTSPELLAEAAAASLQLNFQSAERPLDVIAAFLSSRRALLILDNCEHLIDEAAKFADELLQRCPHLRILATSRQPCGVPGESLVDVLPLPVPATDAPKDISSCESMTLFIERVRATIPDFELTEDNRAALAELCRRMEGIPLALELAAVRMRSLGPVGLLRLLGDRLDALGAGVRAVPDRQRTLHGCIEWSYDLCTTGERALWATASVFAGGFDLDALAAVRPDEPSDNLYELVASLVDKSVVIAEQHGNSARFRMLEVIREHGLARLAEDGRIADARRLHRDYYAALAQDADEHWIGARQVEWLDVLRLELRNLRGALEFCASSADEADVGLGMFAALHNYWIARGGFAEGRHWAERLLAVARPDSPMRIRALCSAVWMATAQFDVDTATSWLDEARAIEPAPRYEQGLIYEASGVIAFVTGDLRLAVDELARARTTFAETVSPAQLWTTCLLSMACAWSGDQRRALELHDEIMRVTEASGESWFRSYTLWQAGMAYDALGDRQRATDVVRESVTLKNRLNDHAGMTNCLECLAWWSEDAERAATLLGAAEALRTEHGLRLAPQMVGQDHDRRQRARAAIGQGRYDAAFARGRSMSAADAVAFALGADRRRSAKTPARASDGLTARERQVAALVADGQSNQQIADTLVLSRRTAEAHVENILVKLGFTSRTQIAVWYVDSDHPADSPGSG